MGKRRRRQGAVVGATSLRELTEISRVLARSSQRIPLLIPGVGTQGGSASDVISSLIKAGRDADLSEDAIGADMLTARINSSSGINYAYERKGISDFAGAAVDAVKELNAEIDMALKKAKISLFLNKEKR